jgi:hypothetical protein
METDVNKHELLAHAQSYPRRATALGNRSMVHNYSSGRSKGVGRGYMPQLKFFRPTIQFNTIQKY